jgi:hypothetical protein
MFQVVIKLNSKLTKHFSIPSKIMKKSAFKKKENSVKREFMSEELEIANLNRTSDLSANKSIGKSQDHEVNFHDHNINCNPWNHEDDELFFQLIQEFENIWKIISTKMYQRSPLSLKNRWHRYLKETFETKLKNSIPKKQKARTAHLLIPNNLKRENSKYFWEDDENLWQTTDVWFEEIS